MSCDRALVIAFAAGAGAAAAALLWRFGGWRLRNEGAKKESEELPTLCRRTTLLVADVDRSLKLYRDALGLQVVFDKTLPIGGKGLPTGVFDAQGRLVFLRSHVDHQVGVIGLLQYLDKPIPKPDAARRRLLCGDSVLVLNTKGCAERMARIARLPGVHVQSRGTVDKYPTAAGSTVTVTGNSFFDPDGHFLELNEVTMGKV
jgi:catechol 2,3-dioxygenase-like lactoylglutathione lyase family enzyme